MKISASIYSDKVRPLKEVIEDLVNHQVDLLHVDCNDDMKVFDDIKSIRQWTKTPIDLHIITETPEKYFPLLRECPVEYLTFQFEQLPEGFKIPADISGKIGLAVVTPTPIEVFDQFSDWDFILIMATIPGQSGGVFDALNFAKIRHFRQKFPGKSIHVDGGVNGEVSFVLRNMGVSSSVSGSYLFNAPSIGHALMDLTKREMESTIRIKDFMIPLEESPVVQKDELSLANVLESIEKGNLGFCLIVDENGRLEGLISNADIRKGMLKNLADLNAMKPISLINTDPFCLNQDRTVSELMKSIRKCSFPISYLPIIDNDKRAKGIITFVNLIKGEL
jgi:ribulose-phosphate 3-epimerase